MAMVSFSLPDSVVSAHGRSLDEFVQALRLAAAMHWYARGEISQGKAAEVAGISRRAFLDELARQRADAFVVDFDDLAREIARG